MSLGMDRFLSSNGKKDTGLKDRQVLVTGGSGFIATHIVRALVEQGASVRVLDNLSTGSRDKVAGSRSQVEFIEGDIRDQIACMRACTGVDTVFHLAAYISVPGSFKDPLNSASINIDGILNMLAAARDC